LTKKRGKGKKEIKKEKVKEEMGGGEGRLTGKAQESK